MPRNKQGGSLASYFYDAAGDGLGPLPAKMPNTKSSGNGLNPQTFLGPDLQKRGRSRSRSSSRPPKQHKAKAAAGPAAPTVTRKQKMAHMQASLATMQKHFKETEILYAQHTAWPLYKIYQKIEECISICKKDIHDARTHTGAGRHQLNIEAVHATRIDTTGWGFKAIFDGINGFAYKAKHNHLTLEKPHHHTDGTHMYVNVVLAWLFAAKSQLMSNLAVYIEQTYEKTPAMAKFLEHEHQGREARAAYHQYKTQLPRREHSKYTLADKTLLTEQYNEMHH